MSFSHPHITAFTHGDDFRYLRPHGRKVGRYCYCCGMPAVTLGDGRPRRGIWHLVAARLVLPFRRSSRYPLPVPCEYVKQIMRSTGVTDIVERYPCFDACVGLPLRSKLAVRCALRSQHVDLQQEEGAGDLCRRRRHAALHQRDHQGKLIIVYRISLQESTW